MDESIHKTGAKENIAKCICGFICRRKSSVQKHITNSEGKNYFGYIW
jgi:hypothetical protein